MKRDHGRNADYYMAPTNCTASWQNTVQQKDYIDAKIREQIMIRSGAYTSGTDQQKSNLFPLLSVSSVSGMAIATNSGNDAPNKLLSMFQSFQEWCGESSAYAAREQLVVKSRTDLNLLSALKL